MGQRDLFDDDYSGVSVDAGPEGDAARRLFMLRWSLVCAVFAFVAAAVSCLLLWIGRSLEIVAMVQPALVLPVVSWSSALVAALLYRIAPSAADERGPLQRWAFWSIVAAFLAAFVATLLSAWFVIIPVIVVLLVLGFWSRS